MRHRHHPGSRGRQGKPPRSWRGPGVGGRGSHVYVETLAERAPQGPNHSPSRPSLGTGTGGDQESAVDAHNGRHGARDALQAGHRQQQRPVEHREVGRAALAARLLAAAAASCCYSTSSAMKARALRPHHARSRRWLLHLHLRRPRPSDPTRHHMSHDCWGTRLGA